MALSPETLAGLVEWCGSAPPLEEERAKARELFFGEGDPRPISYRPGGDDPVGRPRRFLAWFALQHKLPSGERASVLAARALLPRTDRRRTVPLLERARYVTVVVRSVAAGSGLVLELEKERFEVQSKGLGRLVSRDDPVVSHLAPAGRGRWVLGPGWLVLPFRYGPGTRERLSHYQLNAIELERFLQHRSDKRDEEEPEPLRDESLSEAVARMTEAARPAGEPGLVLSTAEWTALVQPFITSLDSMGFASVIMDRLERQLSLEDANRWLHLAMNIWNNTPQPNRGGKSANELRRESLEPMHLELRGGPL